MTDRLIDPKAVYTSRQAAHALGVTGNQLNYMRYTGVINAAHRLPGEHGAFLFERAEIERVLALSTRRAFRRRRRNIAYPMDGLQPVAPRVHKRRLPPLPPEVTP